MVLATVVEAFERRQEQHQPPVLPVGVLAIKGVRECPDAETY